MPRIGQRAHARRRQANAILIIFYLFRQSDNHCFVSNQSGSLKTELTLASTLFFAPSVLLFLRLCEKLAFHAKAQS
jgi:hypothetical protein